MPGYLPGTNRSPTTAVPTVSHMRNRVLEAVLGPGDAWIWHPKNGTVGEMSISRIAARAEDYASDQNVTLQFKVSGKLGFECSVGIAHDAYDGRGLVSSTAPSEKIIGEFGAVLAKIDQVLELMHIGKALSYTTPTEKVEALGASMAALTEALVHLGKTGTSGLSLKVPMLVGRSDLLEIVAMTPLRGNVRVYIYITEKNAP